MAVRPVDRIRRAMGPTVDVLALHRMRTITGRGTKARDAGRVDREVLRAFARQARRVAGGESASRELVEIVALALTGLWDQKSGAALQSPSLRAAVVEQFHRLYAHGSETWQDTWYRGVRVPDCPLDLWLYQEILNACEPDLVIETGSAAGGRAYYLADLCELRDRGTVVTVDAESNPEVKHARITHLDASPVATETAARVEEFLPEGGTAMVIIGSGGGRSHVLDQLRLWHERVPVGGYVVVAGTTAARGTRKSGAARAPVSAIHAFLAEHPEFVVDESKHKHLLTLNSRGYLKRVG